MQCLEQLAAGIETDWLNPDLEAVQPKFTCNERGYIHMLAAQKRFMRFLPYIAEAFPETAAKKGVIESELLRIPEIRKDMVRRGIHVKGTLLMKDDAHLPVAGSVKARGGIHEVLHFAEQLMQKNGLLLPGGDYHRVGDPEFRELFSRYTIHVASTGNLGISIGRTAARMGFKAVVHMSSDAKAWKKELLRSEGCTVIEYESDYSDAVRMGRAKAAEDAFSYFVDDERSEDLFFGYSSAAMRVKVQLRNMGIPVDSDHPLFVYLPCGVGGAPAGITFGMKQMFGKDVHCFFAEPTEAPCFTLAMASGKMDGISVQDIGLSGKTIADGLAVGRASGFACRMMKTLVSGSGTVTDSELLLWQRRVRELENLRVESSACAGLPLLERLCTEGTVLNSYLENGLYDKMEQAVHIVWATGGGMMPLE